jgi:cysteine desulfurase
VNLIHGGNQENSRRSGTENVPAIVGCGVAAEIAKSEIPFRAAHTAKLQTRLWEGLNRSVRYIRLNGPGLGPERISTNLNLSTEFVEGEALLLRLDMQGVAIAAGTSCVSKAMKVSPVLAAIGLDHTLALGSVLMSLGMSNTEEEIDSVVDVFARTVDKLREMSPMWDEFERGLADSVIEPGRRGKTPKENGPSALSGSNR